MNTSFIIAAYNIEKYLDECLQSVRQACRPGDEIIVVNDGSTDGTRDIIIRHASECGAIQLVDKPNGGLSSARNVGLAHARKDYILFMDGDDALNPNSVEQARPVLDKESPDILVTDHQNWLDDGRGELQPSLARSHQQRTKTCNPTRHLIETLDDCIPCVWGRFFRRTLFEDLPANPFPQWSIYDDLPTTPHIVAVARTMYYLPVPLVKYRFRPGSLTRLRTERSCTDLVKAAVHAAQSIRRLPDDPELEIAADALMVRKLMEAIKQGRELEHPTVRVYRDMADTILESLSPRKTALLAHLARSTKPGDANVLKHLKFALRWRAGFVLLQTIQSLYKSRRNRARLRHLAAN